MKIDTDTTALATADEIVALNNSRTSLLAEMESKLAEVRSTYGPAIEQLEGRIKDASAGLKTYCSRKATAERLFGEGKKYAESATARFGFRDSAPMLKTLDTKEKMDDVAGRLASTGNTRFVTIPEPKPAIDKQAVLAANLTAAELADIGLRVTVPSTFYVEALDRAVTSPVTSRTA